MRYVAVLALFSLSSAACGEVEPRLPDWPPPVVDGNDDLAVLWFENDAAADRFMPGCDIWSERVGLRCARSWDKVTAEIKVMVVHDGCPELRPDTYILGLADRDTRTIEMRVDCFVRLAKDLGENAAQIIFAHELGHAVGIWYHVPPDCEWSSVMEHPSGEAVCGPALMGAFIDTGLTGLLRPDELAFDLRTETGAVIGEPIMRSCTLRVQMPQ